MTVAAKQLKDVTTKAKDLMFKEAASMRLLSHKNIVRLYGVVSSGDPYLMITEFVKDGSLKEYLLSRRHSFCFPPLPDVDLIDIATQVKSLTIWRLSQSPSANFFRFRYVAAWLTSRAKMSFIEIWLRGMSS